MNAATRKSDQPIVVKKYANRRLYDTGRSSYVTLDDLCEMVKKNQDFVVYDAKSGDDLTRSVLTQIIVEQESKEGNNLLPTNFLRKLIAFYDDKIQGLVPNYLEHSMDTFIKNQEQLQEQINKSMGGMAGINSMSGMNPMGGIFPGLQAFEDLNKKNLAMFENALRAMTPFPLRPGEAKGTTKQERLNQIRQTIAELQRELQQLQK